MESIDAVALARQLAEWSAEARIAQAAEQRSAARWQRQMASEAASLSAIALDVMACRQQVKLLMHGPPDRTVTITSVCSEFIAVTSDSCALLIVPWQSLRGIEMPGSARSLATGRIDAADVARVSLVEVLTLLVEHRPRVRVGYAGSDDVTTGEAFGVGDDVLVIEVSAETKNTHFVALDMIAEVAII